MAKWDTEWLKADMGGFKAGTKYERERILGLRKEIINCVINYGLTPETYERVCADIEKVIKGENK